MDFPFSQPRCVVCHVQRPFDAFPHRGRVCVHCEDAGFRRIPTEPSMPQPPTPPNRGRGRPRTSSRLGGPRNRARGRRNSSTVRPGQYPEPSPRPLGRPPVLSPPAHTVRPIARLPLAFYSERHRWREHRLGRMNVECPFCRALHWMEERVTGSSMRSPAFSKCCLQGKVPLQTLPAPIASIANLMQDAGPEGTHFRANSRHYNSALSLTSVNFKTDRRIGAGGPIPFQIQGELYHLQGPLDGDADTPPLYAQLWFHDPQYANDVRLQRNSTIKPMVLSEIQHDLWLCNRWVHVYTTAREQLLRLQSRLTPISVLLSPNLRLIQEEGTDQRRYNVPVTDEVGVVVPPLGPEYKRRTFRDLQLTLRGGGNGSGLTRVDPTHPLYCPLAYVILFSRGDEGWGWHCRLRDKSDGPEPTAGDDGDIGHGQLGDPDSVFTDPQSVLEPGEQHVATLDEVVEQAADDLEDDDLEGDDLEDDDRRAETGGRLTHRMWHSFHIHVRPDAFNPLQRSGRLYQQFLVDAAATTDQMKLQWFLRNQSRIRADLYVGLLDALEADEVDGGVNDTDLEGRRVILPSSHTGSERFMIGCYHDAMAIVTYMGKPNLFITMTANPAWPEITAELPPGQSVQDRPDIVARVFEMKKRALLDDLCKRQVFGPAKSRVWTIEYQKRGLPHVHLLLWLEDADRYLQPDIMDQVIFARLPTATEDPDGRLTAIVRKAMIHGPCGELNPDAPCMRDGKCSKNFPKPFQQQTTVPNDGYPSYFRPDNPGTSFVKDTGNRQFHVDNRWVVPYSPYLTLRYGAHINVEVCNSIEAVKYLFKYVYKGGDRATAEVEVNNEIHEYLDGRYIGPTEAAWRLLAFRFHEEFPPVQRLTVHEEGMQPVYFPEELTLEENRDRLRRHLETARTPLMAYFHYNSNAPESEPRYLYPDMPRWFTWNRSTRLWQTRKKGFAIGRIGFCSPAAGDKYFLRLLLLRRVGPKSYDDIRTVEGHLYPTYRAACAALGLLEDDQEWFLAFEEAVRFSSGRALRMMFVFGLVYTSIGDPGQLWDRFKHGLCDDLNYRLSQLPFVPDFEGRQYDYGLYLIGCDLRNSGKSLDSFGLPLPTVDWDAHMFPYDGSREEAEEDCRRLAADMVPRLNHDQRRCFDTVLHAVLHGTSPSCFFVQGAGGTGKTFLYRSIYYQLRSLQKTVICVASSGIASLLLPGGQTAHSCFKIPLRLDETTTCNITPRSDAGKWLLRADLIIWDEVVMQHRIAFEAVHRLLCDLRHDDRPFGGVPVLLGGDFAQTLPVVERGSRSAIVGACLIRSFLWQHLEVLLLRENMRLQGGDINSQFGAWLGRISYEPLFHGTMSIPQYVSTVHDLSWLCERVYPARELSLPQSDEFFASRAILTVRNADLTSINDYVTDAFRGEARPYFSSDVADVGDVGSGAADQLYSREYLASIEHPGLPPSVLRLKIGMPVMLLRNLRRQDGLCNGTRLIIVGLHRRVIQARKIGLSASDDTVYTIPRIQLQTPENYLPFTLQRRQFPIRPCFAMTVNKSQGQSLRHVGIDLRMSVFTHGQLYVALSRTTDVTGLTVLLPPDQSTTENVVYPEVLQPFAAISEEEYEYE